MTKPRSKRKIDTIPTRAAAEPDGQPHFRHCNDCGCFKSKHHGGVCRRYPQPLTKAASDGCWDGVPLPVPEEEGDEQITEAEFRKHPSQGPAKTEKAGVDPSKCYGGWGSDSMKPAIPFDDE